MIKFTLIGKMQSGKNRVLITRTGHRYPTQRFVIWRAEMAQQINRQLYGWPKVTITQPVHAAIRYTPGDKIRRDATGICDALWHLLEHTGVISDDALIQSVDYKQLPINRSLPQCEVEIKPL